MTIYNNPPQTPFGSAVAVKMARWGIKQNAVAELTGLDENTVSRLLTNKKHTDNVIEAVLASQLGRGGLPCSYELFQMVGVELRDPPDRWQLAEDFGDLPTAELQALDRFFDSVRDNLFFEQMKLDEVKQVELAFKVLKREHRAISRIWG